MTNQNKAKCSLCGEPMPPGEEMFQYHGFSGPCPKPRVAQPTFLKELESLINQHSQENASNTPDYILAMFLNNCLRAWNEAVQQRETWYGRDARPSHIEGVNNDRPEQA